jgi:DNA-binding response OmpR family regulator
MTLEFKGFRVLQAGDGESGIALARAEKPDLILLDVMMPGMSGLEAGRALTADPLLSATPVVMLSPLGTADDRSSGLLTGVRAYLVKPFSPWELLDLVEKLTERAPAGA